MIPKENHVVYDGNIDFSKGIEFTISANKFMFETLRKSIYTDPVDSTVREVISNAIDSQVPNGMQNESITVILNEQLVIKDCGTGISPARMLMIAKYGESDKRETNDQVGAFGLGFKSPFSIADQFVVSTIYEESGSNWLINYVCSLDDKGGRIYPLNDPIQTDEQTGTTIKIPINSEYASRVKAAVIKYCNYIQPKPKVYFNDNSVFEQPKIVEENDIFVLYNSKQDYNVLYNNIPYKVSLYDNYRAMEIPGLMFKFKIGECELPASRENIRETPSFKLLVKQSFAAYKEYIKKKVEEDFIKLTTLKEVLEFMTLIEHHHFFVELNGFKFNDVSLDLNNIRKVEKGYKKVNYHNYSNSCKYSDLIDYKILLIENEEKLEQKGYHKIKIGYYIKNIHEKLLINFEDNPHPLLSLLTDRTITLTDIKLPKPPKRIKTGEKKHYRVQTSFRGYDKYRTVDIEEGEYLYDTDLIPNSPWKEYTACRIKENSQVHKKAKKLPNWLTIDELFQNKLIEKKIEKTDLEEMAVYDSMGSICKTVFQDKTFTNGDMLTFAKNNGKISHTEVDKKRRAVYDKYPLVEYINEYANKTLVKKHIEEYIKLIDERKKK